jgi:predicted DNA-binding transcriptional regulator AlpA
MKKETEINNPININPDPFLTEKECSLYINQSLSWLRRRRSEGAPPGCTPGPRFYKNGKSVRYRVSDLEDWLRKHIKEVVE